MSQSSNAVMSGYIPPATLEQLQAGDVLGKYQLLSPIARGGMGQIWAARRTGRLGLPKIVAIKTALPQAERTQDYVEKLFFDEARVAASIDHPNVCRVYELGEEQGILYLAMEWIDGASLFNLLSAMPRPRRMDVRLAAHVVAQACAGLHAAHELTDEDGVPLHVVHRDATPQNILLSATGEVKVVDFGVVKSRDQSHQATVTGELKGKISYFAPEQLLSKNVDRRVDIFALGCVLYLASTGSRPFYGDSPGATMLRIVEGEYERPSKLVADYPKELEGILAKALANKPEDRFATAEDMQRALERFLEHSGPPLSREDVGKFVNKHMGASIEQRKAEIKAAQKLFESQGSGGTSATLPSAQVVGTPGSVAFSVRSGLPVATAPSSAPNPQMQAPTTAHPPHGELTLPEAGAARPQRTPWILAAAISLVATAGAARLAAPVLLGQPTSGEVAVAPAAPAAEQLSASVDAARRTAEPVTITVRATPENATLSIDGGPELPLPHTISTVPDARPHLLEVRAPKHAPLTQSVVFDKSQTLVLELSSAQRTPHAAPRYRGSAPVMAANASRPQAEAPAAPAAAEPAADEFAQPLQKRARKPIDEADPFKE